MAPSIRVRFGRRVRLLRAKRNWYQEDLAAHAGISRSHLSHIERGSPEVCLDTIEHLAEAFEMDISELLQLPTLKK